MIVAMFLLRLVSGINEYFYQVLFFGIVTSAICRINFIINVILFNKLPIVSSEISSTQHVVGAPSSFATTAIAKALLANLRNESKSSIESMMKILKQLREEGSPSVCAKASSCLVALAVACGLPEHLVEAIHSLICIQRTEPASTDSSYDIIQIPENLHRLNLKVQQKIYQGYENSSSWSDRPLENHRVVCSFDLPLISINSPSHNLDDDRRLHGAIASDGMYIYVLNYIGLYKLGTGLQETILGKLYASNNAMKATRNCLLTFCNGSLYLRRRQSSCISVIDTDSLRDIGEVILPTDTAQSALFSDGTAFYHASIGHQSTLNLILLNDSFIPTSDSKSKHSIRLSDVSYCCLGESKAVPHQLPLTIPTNLHKFILII
uniref:RCR-type E3 ubiquitin transferase n=1 Tax=Heterorhabditis bacteriophora TaxID=37862 RepID=A0A1I7X506_HETBA